MENADKSRKVISDISDVDPDLTLAVLELQMLEREKELVQSSRSSASDTYCKFADGDKELSPRFSVATGRWKIIDSLEKGRGRQIKLHETEPFLAIDSVSERKTSPLQNEGSINCQQPQKLQMRSDYRQKTPTSFGPLTSFTRSPCSSPSPSVGCHSARSQGRSTNRFYVSPNAGGPRFNSCIKMPFKHSIRKPRLLENPGQEPGQELKELTALATYHMNRMLQADKHQLQLKRGQLLKGRLKPLVPVSVTGPRIEQCRGILSETRGYTPSASRTLQRRRELMKQMTFGEMDLQVTMLPHDGSDSVHRVSAASSMEDLTNETAEEQGNSRREYEKNDVLDIYFHGDDNTKQAIMNLELIHTNDAVIHRDEIISSGDSNILPLKDIFHMTAETTVYLNDNSQNSSQQVLKSRLAESENKDEKKLEAAQFTTSETSSEVKTDFTHNKERRNQNENKMINTVEGPVDNTFSNFHTEGPQGKLLLPLRRPYSAGNPHTAVHALFHAEMRPSTSATKSVHFADERIDIHENKHKAKLSNSAENIEPYIIDKHKDKEVLNTHTRNESRRGSDRSKKKCADLDIFTSNDSERGFDRTKKKYADLDILTRFDSDKGSERAQENCVDLDILTSNDSDRDSDKIKEKCADVVVHANSGADSRELKKIVSQSIVGDLSLATFAETEKSPVAAREIVDCKYQSPAFSAVHQTTTSKEQGKRDALPKDVISKKEKRVKVPKGKKKTFPKHIHSGVKVTFPEHTFSNQEKAAIPKSVHDCKIQATFPKFAQNCEIKMTVPKLIPNCEEKTTVPKHVIIQTVVPKHVPDGAMYTTALKHVGENKTIASKPVSIDGEHFLKCILENSKEKSSTSLTHLDHTDVINECKETASPNHIKPNGMKEAKASKYTIPNEEKDAKTSVYTIPNEEKETTSPLHTIPIGQKETKPPIQIISNREKETKTAIHTIPNGKKETKIPKHAPPNGKKALKDHKLSISNRLKEATDSTHSMSDGENEAKVPKCTILREEEANVLKHTISNGEKEAQDPKHAIPNGEKEANYSIHTIPNKEQEANCSTHTKKKTMKAPKHITPNEEKCIKSFHYDVTYTNREKYAKTTKQSISNGENLIKLLLRISSQKGESSTSLNQSSHIDTTRKEDQPHHSNISREDKDQPHHSNIAKEDKDQPHHSNIAKEDKDQPHHSNIAREDKDQPHHSNIAKEDKDQPHHSNIAKEDKDQPHYSNIAKEDKDQPHHSNISREDKDQPHHSNIAREDKDQPHHSNIAREDKDQPHYSNIAKEDKDQPHYSNIAKEDKDQPHYSNIAKEDKDQPHYSNIAKEDKDQPHHSNIAKEDKDQPHYSNIAKEDKDQPHHSNIAREDKDQPHHSNIAREDKECALPDHVINFGERKCSIHNEAIPRRESMVTVPELSVPRIESKVTVPELSVPSEEKGTQSYKHAIHKGEKWAKFPKGDKDAKSPKFTILMREKNTKTIKHAIHSEEKVITGLDHTISNREKEANVSKNANFTGKKETFPLCIISNEEKEVTVPNHTISDGEVKASKYDTREKGATFPKHIILKGEKAGKALKHIISNEEIFLKLLQEFSAQKGDSSTSLDQLDEIDSINKDKESAVFQHFISCGETETGGHEHAIQYGEGEAESHKHSIHDRGKEVRPPTQAIHNSGKEAKSFNHVILDRDSEVKSVKHAMFTEDNEAKSHKHSINDRDSEVKSVKHAMFTEDNEAKSLKHSIHDRDSEVKIVKHAMLTEDNEAKSLKHAIHKETNEAKIPMIVISNGTNFLKLLLEISAQRGDSVTSLDQSGHNDTISNMIENNISQSDHNDAINNMIENNTSNCSIDCTNSESQSHNFVIGQIKTDFGIKLPVVKIDDTRLYVGKLNCDNGNIHIRGNTYIAQRQQLIKENVDTGKKKWNGHELALSSFAGEKLLSFGVNVSQNAGEKPLSPGVNVNPNAGEKSLSLGVNVSRKDRDKNTKYNSNVKKASSKHTKCVYTHHSNHPFICLSNDSFSDSVARRLKFGNSPYLQELHVSAPSAKSWPTHKSH